MNKATGDFNKGMTAKRPPVGGAGRGRGSWRRRGGFSYSFAAPIDKLSLSASERYS